MSQDSFALNELLRYPEEKFSEPGGIQMKSKENTQSLSTISQCDN